MRRVPNEPRVASGFASPRPGEQPRQDRRRPKDQRAVLRGELRMGGTSWPAILEDSPSLGLVISIDAPPLGEAELWIEDFGCIPVNVAYSGDRFTGLAVENPVVHRERLMLWLHRHWPTQSRTIRNTPLFLAVADRRRPPT